MKKTAVVPAYNIDSNTLNSVIRDLRSFVDEIIVVDDGSTPTCHSEDEGRRISGEYWIPHAREILLPKQVRSQDDNTIFLHHEINRGQGAALQTGTDYAVRHGAEIIIHFDSDGQHQAKDIPELIKPLEEGKADITIGSRFLGKSKESNLPFTKRYLILPIAKIVNFLFSGLWLTDAHNGLRAFNSKIANQLELSQDRMAHATEYLQLIKKNKIRYTEVPVQIHYNYYGQTISGGLKILRELIIKINSHD